MLSQKLSTSSQKTSKTYRRFLTSKSCWGSKYPYLASHMDLIEREVDFRSLLAGYSASATMPSAKSANPINPFSERAEMLISIPEAARDYLHVSRSTVYRLAEEGAIQIVHVRGSARIPVRSIEAYVASLCGGYR